jgi:hypothetical protein
MKRPRQCGPAHASKAVRSRSAPLKKPAPAALLLHALDDDLLSLVLAHCMSPELAQVCGTCTRLHQLAIDVARLAMLARRPNLLPPPGMPNNWIRALRTDELLRQQLGQPRDEQRSWRSEYIALQTEDFRLYQLLTGDGWREEHISFSGEFFGDTGERPVHTRMRANSDDIEWPSSHTHTSRFAFSSFPTHFSLFTLTRNPHHRRRALDPRLHARQR